MYKYNFYNLIIFILLYIYNCCGFIHNNIYKNKINYNILYIKPKKQHKTPPWSYLYDEEIEPYKLGEPWEKLSKDVANGERRVRLTVKKSHLQIYAAIVDDYKNQVICIASSNLPILSNILGTVSTKDRNNVKAAYEVGKHIGRLALAKGVSKVYFDRSGYKYHGRVEAVAIGARKVGLDL